MPSKRTRYVIFCLLTLTLSTSISLAAGELILRFFERQYFSDAMDYADVLRGNGLGKAGFLKENFDGFVIDGFGNKVHWKNNSDGFRSNHEFAEKPPEGTIRILSMGDSFTAGFRVGQNETFSYLLENWASSQHGKTEVLISMIEDPLTGLDYLKLYLNSFHPDGVFLGITLGNDIVQNFLKYRTQKSESIPDADLGDRNIPPKCLHSKSTAENISWLWHMFYSRLRTVGLVYNQPRAILSSQKAYLTPKLFDAMNGLGFFLENPSDEIKDAYESLFAVLSDYNDFLREKGIAFSIGIFPQKFQIQPFEWELAQREYGLEESCFDLMLPNKLIKAFCEKNSILCIDPTTTMRRQHLTMGTDFYLPRGDMHWSRDGHKAFFESSRESFTKFLTLLKKGKS